MTEISYRAAVARIDPVQQILSLHELAAAGSWAIYEDEYPLHFTGYPLPPDLAPGDAIEFQARLDYYDGKDRLICGDLPSLAAHHEALVHGAWSAMLEPAMRDETLVPPFTHRFAAPVAIVVQDRLARVFHLPVSPRFAPPIIGAMAVFEQARDELRSGDAFRTILAEGWMDVYYNQLHFQASPGLVHVRVTFMRPKNAR